MRLCDLDESVSRRHGVVLTACWLCVQWRLRAEKRQAEIETLELKLTLSTQACVHAVAMVVLWHGDGALTRGWAVDSVCVCVCVLC